MELHRHITTEVGAQYPYTFSEHILLSNHMDACTFPMKYTKCTAVNWVNFAWPIWVSINCDQKIGTTVVCQHKRVTNASSLQNLQKVKYPTEGCPKPAFKQNDTCNKFQWLSFEMFHMKSRKLSESRSPNVQMIGFLLKAIATTIFLPIFSDNFKMYIVPKRYLYTLVYEKHPVPCVHFSAFVVSVVKHSVLIRHKSANLFHCSDTSIISSLGQCDGTCDCNESDHSDESSCDHHTNGFSPDQLFACHAMYYSSHDGRCHTYKFGSSFSGFGSEEKFTCHKSLALDHSLQKDFVVDCYPKGEDEFALKQLLQGNKHFYCNKSGQIPCREGHFICFEVYDICKYKLNKALKLYPCRRGEHLQECKQVECNMMFKCQGYYCVPYSYICNGRWDCPNGEDELAIHGCQQNGNCQYFFNCKTSHICIHMSSVCDNLTDCPNEDDEFACSLAHVPCPLPCQCLTFAVTCSNISAFVKFEEQIFSFFVVSIQFIALHWVVLPSLHNIMILKLLLVKLDCLFDTILKSKHLLFFEVSWSDIGKLKSTCSNDLHLLFVLALTFDQITHLPHKTFCNLLSLKFLDLSGNLLTQLQSSAFANTSGRILTLYNNTFLPKEFNMLQSYDVQVLRTDDFQLCCKLEADAVCSSSIPWYAKCSRLLTNTSLRVSFYTISTIIFVLNTCSASLQQCWRKSRHQKQKAFHQVAVVLNLCDMIFSLCLILIWCVDLHFHENYILRERNWRSSPLCFSVFGTFSFVSVLTPLLLCLFSAMRLVAVKYPLNIKVKCPHFVKKVICSILVSTLLLCGFFVILCVMLMMSGHQFPSGVPTGLCSPFVDPLKQNVSLNIFTWSITILNLGSLLFVIVCNMLLCFALKLSQHAIKAAFGKLQTMKPLVLQLITLVVINICSWIPSSTVFLTALYVKQYPPEMIAWATICVTTINSLFNPIVLIVTTLRKLLH